MFPMKCKNIMMIPLLQTPPHKNRSFSLNNHNKTYSDFNSRVIIPSPKLSIPVAHNYYHQCRPSNVDNSSSANTTPYSKSNTTSTQSLKLKAKFEQILKKQNRTPQNQSVLFNQYHWQSEQTYAQRSHSHSNSNSNTNSNNNSMNNSKCHKSKLIFFKGNYNYKINQSKRQIQSISKRSIIDSQNNAINNYNQTVYMSSNNNSNYDKCKTAQRDHHRINNNNTHNNNNMHDNNSNNNNSSVDYVMRQIKSLKINIHSPIQIKGINMKTPTHENYRNRNRSKNKYDDYSSIQEQQLTLNQDRNKPKIRIRCNKVNDNNNRNSDNNDDNIDDNNNNNNMNNDSSMIKKGKKVLQIFRRYHHHKNGNAQDYQQQYDHVQSDLALGMHGVVPARNRNMKNKYQVSLKGNNKNVEQFQPWLMRENSSDFIQQII